MQQSSTEGTITLLPKSWFSIYTPKPCKRLALHLKYICTCNLLYTRMKELDLNASSEGTESLNVNEHIVILPKSTL